RRGLDGTLSSYRETVKVALVHLDVPGQSERVVDAIRATGSETEDDMADVAADEAMTRSAVRGGLDSRKREICSRLAEGRTLPDVCRDNHELPEPPHRRASLRRLQMTRDNLMPRNCRLFQQNRPIGDIRRASGRAWTINMSSRREPSLP